MNEEVGMMIVEMYIHLAPKKGKAVKLHTKHSVTRDEAEQEFRDFKAANPGLNPLTLNAVWQGEKYYLG
jgi:hypothetical protein